MMFVVVLALAITYGIQNGNDRRTVEKTEAVAKDLSAVGSKIGAIKLRNWKRRTTTSVRMLK
jgi:hypothetical protein